MADPNEEFKERFYQEPLTLGRVKLCIENKKWASTIYGKSAEDNIIHPETDLEAITHLPADHPVSGGPECHSLITLRYKHTKYGRGIERAVLVKGIFKEVEGIPIFSISKITEEIES